MLKRLKNIPFLLLILFQILPIIIVFIYIVDKNKLTENSGWITSKNRDCKYFTGRNYENRNFIWSGDCKDGFADGSGKLILFENDIKYYVFEGFISKGRIEGLGKIIFLFDGDTYEGNYVNGKPNGYGHLYNDDGDHYEGNFEDGLRHGKGTYWYSPESELFKYVGEWENGKENGKGTLYYRNGKKILGHFKNGILEEISEPD